MATNKKQIIYIVIAAVIIAVLVFAVIYFVQQSGKKDTEMRELVEMMDLEKERLENEYADLSVEFGDYASGLSNDSLVQLLDEQKIKVQHLLDELKITKSTNARRIQELKDELASVRKVMVHYVAQIDSLNQLNERLTTENKEVRRKYLAATETVEQLSKEKEDLSQVVTRASIIEMSNFSFVPLNDKGRRTKRLNQIANLQFNYTIVKNVTATPGEKTLYLRITRPDDVVLTKGQQNVFPFENKEIAYSARKSFEYANEAIDGTIYYKVDEMLPAGKYRADFFLDGNRIGNYTFEIEK